MRILILNHNVRGRGTYHRALPFARLFAARGHEVAFCCVHPERLYRPTFVRRRFDGGGTLVYCEMPRWSGRHDPQEGRGPLDIARRLWLVATRRFDVVWAFEHKLNCLYPARLARRLYGTTFVSDWCDRWGGEEGLFDFCQSEEGFLRLPPAVQRIRRRAFAQEARLEESVRRDEADAVTVISRALRERALNIGVPKDRLLLLPTGADVDGIRPLDKDECRREFGLPTDAPVLGYVANFNPDAPLLLDALQAILAAAPRALCLHAGAPLTGSEYALRERGLSNRLHHLGWIPPERCALLYGASDILLLPLSRMRLNVERFPHKLTDYLAAGRPIAANDVGDVRPLIEAKGAGEVAYPNAQGLADATLRLLQRHEEWPEIGRRARQTAEELLDWNRIAEQSLDFIMRVRAMGRRRRN